MYDEEDDIYENEVEFLAERDAWNRVGGVDIGLGLGGVINLKRSGYTITEKFKLISLATINIINDLEYDERTIFTMSQITHMLNLIEKLPDYEYKNPSAFVYGYIVALYSDYKTLDLDKSILEIMFEINKEIEGQLFTKIDETDIIRYARLCLSHNLK